MPKKFRGENSKAVEARARRAAQKDAETERKQQQLEDEFWKEDDKNVLKKLHRKEEKERKKTDQLERKKESQRLADEEMQSIRTSATVASGTTGRLTRADIEEHHARMISAATSSSSTGTGSNVVVVDEQPLEENINRLTVDGLEARSVDEAIKVLSKESDQSVDLHPEKRVKAAYLAYEERRLAEVKADNPNLRLSQLKQIIKKDWNKSPDNPLNQRLHAR